MKVAEKDRALFMKYALPCVKVLVKRGKVTENYLNSLIEMMRNGEEIPEGSEKIPAVAFAMCSLMAMDEGKKMIDKDVIHEYFLFRHDDMIDKRYEEMGDFDPDLCRTRVGRIESVEEGLAFVSTRNGKKRYRTDFTPDLKKNDMVVTHWDFVVEKIDEETAKKIEQSKKLPVDAFKERLQKRGILVNREARK